MLRQKRRNITKDEMWISVKYRLPKDYQNVILYYENGKTEIGAYYKCLKKFTFESCYGKVTHWMPLPKAPIKNGKGAKKCYTD